MRGHRIPTRPRRANPALVSLQAMPGPHSFTYEGTHTLPLSRARAWDLLRQPHLYSKWWPWMRRLEVSGAPLEPGTTFTFYVVAPIPFPLRLVVEIVESKEDERIEASVAGDLVGRAEMSFAEISGDVTQATLRWDVDVRKQGVRTAARTLRSILQWGQTWAVDVALRGFLRHLDRNT